MNEGRTEDSTSGASWTDEGTAEAPEPRVEGSVARAFPGLARIAAAAWWRTTGWSIEASVRAGSRLARAAVSGQPPAELFRSTGADLRDYARRLLDLGGVGERTRSDEPEPATRVSAGDPPGSDQTTTALRSRGADLLRRSADVHAEEDVHPAYARILGDLAPDEARILRLLALKGPQPSVDVRAGLPLVGSELIAPGLSMIGAEAGCRNLDQVHAYLNNLYRLGLIWFSREPVKDRLHYQVLEAQPEVTEAMRKAGRTARTVRRSIHLTPFGEDFCATCLPLSGSPRTQ